MIIKREIEVDITPTVVELATAFCEMDSNQQAIFFREIGRLVSDWDGTLSLQCQSIVDSEYFTDDARFVMRKLGEYAK
jgi:hypothetical protein